MSGDEEWADFMVDRTRAVTTLAAPQMRLTRGEREALGAVVPAKVVDLLAPVVAVILADRSESGPFVGADGALLGRAARAIEGDWLKETWNPRDRAFHLAIAELFMTVAMQGSDVVERVEAVASLYLGESA